MFTLYKCIRAHHNRLILHCFPLFLTASRLYFYHKFSDLSSALFAHSCILALFYQTTPSSSRTYFYYRFSDLIRVFFAHSCIIIPLLSNISFLSYCTTTSSSMSYFYSKFSDLIRVHFVPSQVLITLVPLTVMALSRQNKCSSTQPPYYMSYSVSLPV